MTDQQAARVYVDPREGFSLRMPGGWMVDTSGQQGSRVIFYAPTVEDTFRASVNVVVQDLAPIPVHGRQLIALGDGRPFSPNACVGGGGGRQFDAVRPA